MNYNAAQISAPKPPMAMSYICAECGSENEIKPKEPIRCKECGYRIMYKRRTRRSTYCPIHPYSLLLSPQKSQFFRVQLSTSVVDMKGDLPEDSRIRVSAVGRGHIFFFELSLLRRTNCFHVERHHYWSLVQFEAR
ncbi:DNA-directed RNA polymerase core subunit rpc10 [Modicella reniformis]|uniref:DNA-directed RNA polymerase core subunit rpc10 n=1 Tax=Modicella reniformis TaxID=1440133 RepID=A0A9P6IJY3_9FUNG|nr:DNA-directed RNA polymerase core subunit rpc10 [Modicella reniformis]